MLNNLSNNNLEIWFDVEDGGGITIENYFSGDENKIERFEFSDGTVVTDITPYIKGNGEYIGVFVIEEISKTTEQTTPEGDLLSIQVEIHLKEYTGKIPENDETEKGFKKKA